MTELIRNAPVQEALDVWATTKDGRTFSTVLRRALVGELLLDVSTSTFADPARPFQPGDTIAIASQTDNAGTHLLVAFTDNERMAGRHPLPVSLGQPAAAVLEQAIRDYEGLVLDPGHPGMFIAYAEELRRGLGDDPAAAARLADDLATRARPFDAFLADLAAAPVYVPAQVHAATADRPESVSVLLARGATDGESLHPVFTSPAECWAWAPEAQARPTRLANVAQAALEDGLEGVVVNPAGPSITIPRTDLEGLVAPRDGGA